jgi:hypothetical protein
MSIEVLEELDRAISLGDDLREDLRTDAVRLGLIKSYGNLNGEPVYKPTAALVLLNICLERQIPEVAKERWDAYRSTKTRDEAAALLDAWLAEDPGAVIPLPPPPEERRRRRPTEAERALMRIGADELVEEGLCEVAGVRSDGDPIYRRKPGLSDSEFRRKAAEILKELDEGDA